MKCPFCSENFFETRNAFPIEKDIEGEWGIIYDICPSCKKAIFKLNKGTFFIISSAAGLRTNTRGFAPGENEILVRPRVSNRSPIPPQVPKKFTEDYQEACLVLVDSPKASAALSRRCLQNIIREKLGIKKRNLADEIQEVLDNKIFPSYISEPLDAVRNIGNFGAHPFKSTSTGEICPVEPGEAEWNLNVIESLFDFLFVQPDIIQKKKEALNKKLIDAGKPPMK
jgi:hypothetical protein